MGRSKFIDFAKGFSILTIVIYHFLSKIPLNKFLEQAIHIGGSGVHLFFFASGYGLMTSGFKNSKIFYEKRLKNLLIPYYIAITVIFLINLKLALYPDGINAYLSHIFLYKMFVPKFETSFGIQFWFVSTIIQFYLVFPLLYFLVQKNNDRNIVIACFIISLIYSFLVSISPYANERVVNSFFLQYLWEFVLGMVVAKRNVLNSLINRPIITYLALSLFCLCLTALLVIKGGIVGRNFDDVFSFLGYTGLIIIIYRLTEHNFFLSSLFLKLAEIAFSLYLFHILVFDIVEKYFHITTHVYYIIFVLIISLVIAYFYTLIINKIMKRRVAVNR